MHLTEKEKFYKKIRLVNDIVSVFGAETLASEQIKNHAIHVATYNWTEIDGKYEGNRYWSIRALLDLKVQKKPNEIKYIHEHIVPRRKIREEVLKLPKVTFDAVYGILESCLIGVVVKPEEDKLLNSMGLRQKMPDELKKPDMKFIGEPWGRYLYHNQETKGPRIQIVELDWTNECKFVQPILGLDEIDLISLREQYPLDVIFSLTDESEQN